MSMGPPAGSKRKAPAGGPGLLDSILGGMSRTMAKVPVQKPGQAAREEQMARLDGHYGMLAKPSAADVAAAAAGGRVCRNSMCGRTDFDTDFRQGDRVCRHCGTIQNTRSIESQEEEHRSFADDDKKESKKRAEQTRDGRTGGAVGEKNLQQAMQLANAHAGGTDDMPEADAKKLEQYQRQVGELASRMSLQGQIVHDAKSLCERLVLNQLDHKKGCKRESCRLHFKPKAALVATGVLKEALRNNGVDRLLEEFKSALAGLDLDAAEIRKVGRYAGLVHEVLKGKPYGCSDAAPAAQPPAGAAGEGGGEDAAASTNRNAIHVLPRMCDDMRLPYFMQRRATEIIEDWSKVGLPAIMPQTIAACAIMRAADEIVPHALRRGAAPDSLPKADAAAVARASGIAENTIAKQVRHPELPWPTTLVNDLATKLNLPKGLAVAARVKLDTWLQEVNGAKRNWVRDQRPRLLAACAIVLAGREAADGAAIEASRVADEIQDADGQQLAKALESAPMA